MSAAPRGAFVALAAIAVSVTACGAGASPVGTVRFVNAPPVWRVNDRQDVPKQPEENPFYRPFYHFTSYLLLARRALNLTRDRRALGINSIDEVPDSTFFTNRIGVRDLSLDEIRQGSPGDSPIEHRPWTIKSSKVGGSVPGFICEDAQGRKFLLKFSSKQEPELESAADVITARLMWASGWNVPSDHVLFFNEDDLVLGPDATTKVKGKKVKLTAAMLAAQFARAVRRPDGTFRGTASIYIGGKPLGGMPRLGVREDDPNDIVPHQLRRDQRGMAPVSAWLAHTDMKEDNTLDSWEPDPADKNRHYVVHYHIDFGNSLGAFPRSNRRPQPDFTHEVDPEEWTLSFLTLGFYRQPWEGRIDPKIPGLGMYAAGDYEPQRWKPNPMGQFPVLFADRYDQFWGSKILIRFSRAQLAAAIEMGRLSDPRAAPYLLETMVARQRRTALHWFRRVNPVDEFTVEAERFCFVDLALRHHLVSEPTTFAIDAFDEAGRPLTRTPERLTPDAAGRACTTRLPRGGATSDGHYTIFRITNSRGMPATLLHLADDPNTSRPRIIGLRRL